MNEEKTEYVDLLPNTPKYIEEPRYWFDLPTDDLQTILERAMNDPDDPVVAVENVLEQWHKFMFRFETGLSYIPITNPVFLNALIASCETTVYSDEETIILCKAIYSTYGMQLDEQMVAGLLKLGGKLNKDQVATLQNDVSFENAIRLSVAVHSDFTAHERVLHVMNTLISFCGDVDAQCIANIYQKIYANKLQFRDVFITMMELENNKSTYGNLNAAQLHTFDCAIDVTYQIVNTMSSYEIKIVLDSYRNRFGIDDFTHTNRFDKYQRIALIRRDMIMIIPWV